MSDERERERKMAAASSVDAFTVTAIKTRHVPRERLRNVGGGSFGDRRARSMT